MDSKDGCQTLSGTICVFRFSLSCGLLSPLPEKQKTCFSTSTKLSLSRPLMGFIFYEQKYPLLTKQILQNRSKFLQNRAFFILPNLVKSVTISL